jgi:hypothetical protein
MRYGRYDHTATLLPGGEVLVAGGYHLDGTSYGSLSSAERYVPDAVAPTITTQPADQAVVAGQTASFTAAAAGTPAPAVRWQLSTDGGASFADLAGATSPTLSFVPTSVAASGTEYRAVFTNSGGSATTAAATLTVTPAAAGLLVVSGFPAQVTAGDAGAALTVTAYDAYGNVASGYRGAVAFASTDGNASLPDAYPFTPADAGAHTFTGVVLRTAGTRFVTAYDTAQDTLFAEARVSVVAAAADHLLFLRQPSDTTVGQPIGPAVRVAVVDRFGNVVTSDSSDTVTLSLGNNPGGGTLSGTVTMTVVNGVATFSDLSIDAAGSGYTLHASAGGSLADADSDPFNVTP